MVSFLPLNIRDEDSVALILSHIDNATQYGEDQEPTEPKVCAEGLMLNAMSIYESYHYANIEFVLLI